MFLRTLVRQEPADCRLHFRRSKMFACILPFPGPEWVYCRRHFRSGQRSRRDVFSMIVDAISASVFYRCLRRTQTSNFTTTIKRKLRFGRLNRPGRHPYARFGFLHICWIDSGKGFGHIFVQERRRPAARRTQRTRSATLGIRREPPKLYNKIAIIKHELPKTVPIFTNRGTRRALILI